MELLRKWNSISLIWRIVIGLVIGAVLGVCSQAFAWDQIMIIDLLGTLFVSALKAVAPILVFFLVLSALANAKTAGSMKTVILLYIVSTILSAFIAVLVSFVFPVDITLANPPEDVAASPEGIERRVSHARDQHLLQPRRCAHEGQLHRHPGMGDRPRHRAA